MFVVGGGGVGGGKGGRGKGILKPQAWKGWGIVFSPDRSMRTSSLQSETQSLSHTATVRAGGPSHHLSFIKADSKIC
jgi:hypothetical protein